VTAGLDIVNIAQKQVGFVEGPNNDNIYGIWYGVNHEPYCAMFVSWCFAQANVSHLVAAQTTKGFAYCPDGLAWFQKNKQVVGKYDGLPGDIVFYSFNGNGQADHVEIIVGASKDGITTIGGNTSPDHALNASQANGNGVYLRHRPYLYVMAVCRPNYSGSSTPAKSLGTNKPLATGVAGVTALTGGGAALLHNTTPTQTKTPTVLVAPPFPGTSAFKIGYKNQAAMIVEKALEKAGLLPSSLVTGTLSAEDLALVPVYQNKLKIKKSKGLDASTYSSMIKEAGK
jgi:hypothetical protein